MTSLAPPLAIEEALQRSELRYQRLFETAPDGILVLDAETGQVVDANPFMQALLGYSPDEFVGRTLWEMGPFKSVDIIKTLFAELQVKDSVRYESISLERKDGGRVEAEFISNAYVAEARRLIQCNIRDITERRKNEEALRLSESRYRRLFETAQDGILILDAASGQVVDANPFILTLLGYSSDELVGRCLWEIGPFKNIEISKDVFAELKVKDSIRYESLSLEKKDGRCVEAEFISNAYFADLRQLIQCNIRDITERKRLEKLAEEKTAELTFSNAELLSKTAFFEAQVNSALDAILIVDGEGKKLLQNQRMVELWEIPQEFAEEADNTRRLDWVADQNKNSAQFLDQVDYLYAHPDEIGHDELELKNGKFFDRYSAPVRDKEGRHYGRIWSYRDITERKQAEQRIVEQASFLDKAQDAILVRDLEGRIIYWNQGAERMYGLTRGEVMGRRESDLYSANAKKFDEANRQTIQAGEWSGELVHLNRDRQEINVEARWTLIRDNDGQPKSVLAINTDITEKKRTEIQFLRAQRMEGIGTLAGGIAHDLNNILAPIMMSIDLLKTTAEDPQSQKMLETIDVSAKRGAAIVRQVLSFARGLEGERVEIQPKHLLNDLEHIIKDTFPKDIHLEFWNPADIWTVLGDPTQVQQILLNLCVNARDAMPNGGNLSVSVENCVLDEQYAAMNGKVKAGHYVKIKVADSGMGISPALINKIFDPFFTTKEVGKGTGLGLSTVMAIVKSHAGVINVYSEPGKGTHFSVYLPALEASGLAQDVASAPEPTSLPRGQGELILVVDDELSILGITGQTLQGFGYRVVTATDGADAVAIYAQRRDEIAVVLTDMMMPVMDGQGMIRVLTRINPDVKIIATSGLTTNGNLVQVPGSGVKHFLTKPYTAGALLTTLRLVLGHV
jgi:PAS domain S-box-containing protein